MNETATKQDLQQLEERLEKRIDKAVEDLSEIISTFAQQVDWRFNKVEADIRELKASPVFLSKISSRD